MDRLRYQFNNIGTEQIRSRRRLRLAVIFILISAVTAGIIYLTIPKKEVTSTDVTTQKRAVTSQDTSVSDGVPVQTDSQDKQTEKTVSSADGEKSSEDGEVIQSDKENVSGESATVSKENSATDEPQKGKVWKGDPANDAPASVENRSQADVLETMRSSFADRNGKVAHYALEVIAKENEGSSYYRTAAEYLRRTRQNELAIRDGVPGISYRYTIRGGDSLSRIARRNKTTVQALMAYNNLENGLIRIGDKLTVTPGPWKIEVSCSNRLLKLYQGKENKLFCVFEVGIGRGKSTPRGSFVVSTRLKDPKWYAPHGRVFEPGEEGNELGKYYLKLAASGSPDRPLLGYGIHGTPDENTVGSSVSSGCIRMRSADIEMLYNLVPENTPVIITE